MMFYQGTVSAKAGEAVPYASGNLSGGKGYAFDSQDLTKGQKVTVNANWTPTSANVQIGLIDNNTGYGLVKTVSNGSGSAPSKLPATPTSLSLLAICLPAASTLMCPIL